VNQTRVLTVGAYERDNFGDLLFLLLTERYLSGRDVIAAAPFAADMTPLLDRRVVALGDALTRDEFDVIWTVGGQVGGTTPESALRMSKAPAEHDVFRATVPTSPYIPTPGAFPRNAGAVSVLNSVGLTGAAVLPPHVREEVVEVLRTTDVVSVRDRESSDLLTRLGVTHTLAPDVVHAISLLEPHDPDPASDIAVVQFSTRLLERIGHARLARHLVRSKHLGGLRFRFVMAGTAPKHDSVEGLERVAERVRALDPGREVEVLTDRRPLDIVRQIREARIVIGTSLHVRIVAAAYAVPRVTMRRVKPTRYAAHWDDQMPFDVRAVDLEDAIGAALAAGTRAEVRTESERLSRLADDNVRAIVERVTELVARGSDVQRKELAERRQRRHGSIASRRAACAVVTDQLRAELDEARRELAVSRAEVERLRRRVPIRLRAR